jgi:hypothetical protein
MDADWNVGRLLYDNSNYTEYLFEFVESEKLFAGINVKAIWNDDRWDEETFPRIRDLHGIKMQRQSSKVG